MNLDLPPTLFWHNAQLSDAQAILSLIHKGAQALHTISTMQLKDVQAILQSPRFSANESCLIFINQQPDPILLGFCWLLRLPQRPNQAEVWIQIHPHLDQFGLSPQVIEDPLYAWLFYSSRQHFSSSITDDSYDPALGCWLVGSSWQDDQTRCASFLKVGFYPLRFLLHMRRKLSGIQQDPLPVLPLPCTLLPFDSSFSQLVYQIYQEIFQDDWLFQASSFAAWQELWINKPNFLPDLSFTVWAENEVIGFLLTEEHSAENIRTAHINSLGIKPSWRNRGIAKYLLHFALHAFSASGFSYATLDADPDNPYNPVEFYQKAHFIPLRMKVYFGKLIEDQQA